MLGEMAMATPGLPAAKRLIDQMRALYAEGLEGAELWARIEQAMRPLLADPALKTHARNWPATIEASPTVKNLLFYEDPDYGFAFNATVRQPNLITNVHDHGNVWTLYGLIEGRETMYRYERTDGGPPDSGPATLERVGCNEIGPGDIDVVPPGKIHQEHAGPVRSIAFIVRARRPGTFPQHYYDPETGAVAVTNGPVQIPYDLS
jgi:predicted metal-dependent enzyme (double-stranded beta helix superfamily)